MHDQSRCPLLFVFFLVRFLPVDSPVLPVELQVFDAPYACDLRRSRLDSGGEWVGAPSFRTEP